MYEKVFAYLDAHAEDYAAQLCRWVEVPSVKGEATPGAGSLAADSQLSDGRHSRRALRRGDPQNADDGAKRRQGAGL